MSGDAEGENSGKEQQMSCCAINMGTPGDRVRPVSVVFYRGSNMANKAEELSDKSELNIVENGHFRLTGEFKISNLSSDEQQEVFHIINLEGTTFGAPFELARWLGLEIRRLCKLGFTNGFVKDWTVHSDGHDDKD
jgi:hypothetical protein